MSRKRAQKARRRERVRQRRAAKESRRRTARTGVCATRPPRLFIEERADPSFVLSEVIAEYAEPLLEGQDTEEEIRNAFDIAVLLWNLSFLPREERQQILDRPAARGTEPGAELMPAIEFMIERRRREFSCCNRLVLAHELFQVGDDLRFEVLSTPIDEETLREWAERESSPAPSLQAHDRAGRYPRTGVMRWLRQRNRPAVLP